MSRIDFFCYSRHYIGMVVFIFNYLSITTNHRVVRNWNILVLTILENKNNDSGSNGEWNWNCRYCWKLLTTWIIFYWNYKYIMAIEGERPVK